ncbi:hypothetical protein DID88_008873 [Monilinia fructigena]|uniref:Uncharacterized protein n=1 Tax=Monilinia fructigena TaxID=38457 RepID=A0A395J946_9HELO|nr:hypothetical protein DID88_008873 [Monilinia fructigena]
MPFLHALFISIPIIHTEPPMKYQKPSKVFLLKTLIALRYTPTQMLLFHPSFDFVLVSSSIHLRIEYT